MIKQQETELLSSFRIMHPEDRLFLMDYARERANENIKAKSHLSLVVTSTRPSFMTSFGSGSSGAEDIFATPVTRLLKQ